MGKATILAGVLVGAGIGASVTYFALGSRKTRIYVSTELCTYIGTLLPDSLYNPLFDANKDGRIDMRDVAWFVQHSGTWVELPV